MTNTTTTTKRIEIAYHTFDRNGRMTPKRKIVNEKSLERALEKIAESGAVVYGTRDAD